MKILIYFLLICTVIIIAPGGFAQTASNSDFDPFPQMEQDQKNVDDDTTVNPEQQNDDAWPPANNDAQANSEADHE